MMMASSYTSIFKINGEPIIPPLMTLEKRLEMQMYREKAIQLERNFTEERKNKKVQFCETPIEVTPLEELSLDCTINESASARSDLDENPNSGGSPPDTLVRDKERGDSAKNTQIREEETKLRMQKLSKSETVCFDVNQKTIMGKLTKEQMERLRIAIEQEMEKEKMKTNENVQSQVQRLIPAICVNPPTPLAGPKNICDLYSGSESCINSAIQSSEATENVVLDIADDSSGDSTENTISSAHMRSSARMLHFEQTKNDDLAHEDSEEMRSPQRSATSPSLKSLSDTNGTCSLTTSPRADDTSAMSMVRSNSFTLDRPSKVLVDHHMGQKSREVGGKEEEHGNRSPTPSRQPRAVQRSPSSPHAYRDTVESKAKRVQKKVDKKPPIPRSKSKNVFHNYASSAAHVLNSAPEPVKVKRSPYDPKGKAIPTKPNNKALHSKSQMSSRNQKSSTVRKSASSTTYTIKPTVAGANTLPNNNMTYRHADLPENNTMNEIDLRHREKLLALLSQQQEEERRLRQAFETQQRMLLEQLNNEKYQNFSPPMDDPIIPALNIEGMSLMSPNQLDAEKGIPFNNDNNAASPFNCSNVNSSVVQPGNRDVLSGFPSSTNCELPFNQVPSKANILHLTASNSVDVPPLNYTNNVKPCERIGPAVENKQLFTFRKE